MHPKAINCLHASKSNQPVNMHACMHPNAIILTPCMHARSSAWTHLRVYTTPDAYPCASTAQQATCTECLFNAANLLGTAHNTTTTAQQLTSRHLETPSKSTTSMLHDSQPGAKRHATNADLAKTAQLPMGCVAADKLCT